MAIEDFVLETVLKFADVPENIVNDLEREMPAFARLCRAAKLLAPVITEAKPTITRLIPKLQAIWNAPVREAATMTGDLAPLIDKLQPSFGQAMAILNPEQKDFEDAWPVVSELIDFISKKYPTSLGSGVE